MDSENNNNSDTTSNKSDEDCVLVEDNENTTLDESNLNTTIGNEANKLAAKTPISQTKKANKNPDLNSSVTNSCEKSSREQKMQQKIENAKKRQEEKEKKEREKKEKEELRAKQEEERKRKKEEEEKLRQKRLEEKEKQTQERLEKERKRQEQLNLRNEEKRKKEEERKRLEEEKKRAEEEKLKEEEEKRRKADKVKTQFASFFIKKDTPQQADREELKNLRFMPFQLKENMHLAPICRHVKFSKMTQEEREEFIGNFDQIINNESSDKDISNFLKQYKENGKGFRSNPKSCKRGRLNKIAKSEIKTDEGSNDSIKLVDDIVPVNTITKYKIKYLHFDPKQYRRPPYYGTWNKKSKLVRARNPFAKDEKLIDYEIDSDDEWEDEADGESIADSDKGDMEEDAVNGDDEDDDGFFVPHGHLSDDELDEDERNLDEETKKAREQARKEQYEMERKKTSKYLVPKCFYLKEYWNVPDKLDLDSIGPELKQLNKFQMVPIMTQLPIIISNEVFDKKSDETKSTKNIDNISSPNPTPKSKSNKQKQNSNNSISQSPCTTPSTVNNPANNKGSIIKFISKLSNKTCKLEQISANNADTNSETTSSEDKTNIADEKNICKTTDSINNKKTPTVKLRKGNSTVILKQGSPSTPLNSKNTTNTSTTAEKRSLNENGESAVKRLKLDDGQTNETQKSASKTTASPTILTLFKNSTCRKTLRLSTCEIDMTEEDSNGKSKDDEVCSTKTDVLMDTSESVDINTNKENKALITID